MAFIYFADFVNSDGDNDEAVKLYNDLIKYLDSTPSSNVEAPITSTKMIDFYDKGGQRYLIYNKFVNPELIDRMIKKYPKSKIYFVDQKTQEVANEWCLKNKKICYYGAEYFDKRELTIEIIDKIYQCPTASIIDTIKQIELEFSEDIVHKIREIRKRDVSPNCFFPIFIIVKKESDYKEILDYTTKEKKELVEKTMIYNSIRHVNGFCVSSLTLDLQFGNFDDYYFCSRTSTILSESAMIYLIKNKLMYKQWASRLSDDRIKFLYDNGYDNFSQ